MVVYWNLRQSEIIAQGGSFLKYCFETNSIKGSILDIKLGSIKALTMEFERWIVVSGVEYILMYWPIY